MAEHNNGTIRTVVWSEVFPWLKLVRAFRVAIATRCLVFGAVGVILTAVGWSLIASLFASPAATCYLGGTGEECPWTTVTSLVPDRPQILSFCRPQPTYLERHKGDTPPPDMEDWNEWVRTGGARSIALPWQGLTEPALHGLAAKGIGLSDAVAFLLYGIWAVAVWALFGGAICRTAAVSLAADEQVGLAMALRFAWRKWPSYVAGPLLLVGVLLLIGLLVLILGWMMRADVLLFLGAFLWPLVLLAGAAMTLLLIGALFGWPLMWGTISTEGTDSFDGLSRSYAYIQRPLHYLFYAAVAGFIGWLGWLLVREFASSVVWMGYWAAGWGSGVERLNSIRGVEGSVPLTGVAWFGAKVIHFFVGCVKLLAVGYLFSYFWSASAAIYLQLRRDVDTTETDEVFLDADATEPSPELPAITTDQAGAPVVARNTTETANEPPHDESEPAAE
jgi:hypothetical protein